MQISVMLSDTSNNNLSPSSGAAATEACVAVDRGSYRPNPFQNDVYLLVIYTSKYLLKKERIIT